MQLPHQSGAEESMNKATSLHCCRDPGSCLTGLAMLLLLPLQHKNYQTA
jgi:hypothetical protein